MSLLTVLPSLISLGSELIEDKDKKNEFAHKIMEMEADLQKELLKTKTMPKVDAFVKLVLCIKPLIRPIGGALMTAFGMYAHWKGIPIDTALHAIFDGALPAWGVSRHVEKQKQKAEPVSDLDIWGDDAKG